MMVSRKLFFACFLLYFLGCFKVCSSDPLTYICPNDATYDINSTSGRVYRKNLDSLLSALTSNAYRPNGFYSYASGGVYGLFLCRGDVKATDCEDCLNSACSDVLGLCPNGTSADIWYDKCMLRYSDESIFSRLDTNFLQNIPDSEGVTDTATFNQVLANAFDKIVNSAAKDDSGKKFAVEEANFTSTQKVYALGQCTPDLSNSDCELCLRNSISVLLSCCINRLGGRVINRSCNIRHQTYPFYQVSEPPPPNPLPAPPPPSNATTKDNGLSTGKIVAIVIPAIVVFIMFLCITTRKVKKMQQIPDELTDRDGITIDPESIQYSLIAVRIATDNFSAESKIGQGGFGGVYKGKLPNGECMAVKRLSRRSGQGAVEFKNEIGVIVKLQHKNLVRLLGFCLEGEEKILVYEFVPNRSLDYFLFDPQKQGLLNWSRRYNIIRGIARGLLYLHEESRLKIVHRDLKAANILLDQSMEPKIADFGMAKICGVDESKANTTTIAGTFGYMAPEYARSGEYSIKSDVFSFGVVVLEIITGKKNSSFYQSKASEDLISHAWRQWKEGTPLGLLDPTIGDCYVKNEVIQSVHIGLSCVEEDANKRPTMASVVQMLNQASVSLPTLHHPAVRSQSRLESLDLELGSDQANAELALVSIAEASITEPYPR